MIRSRIAVAAVSVLALSAMAACGSNGSSSSTPKANKNATIILGTTDSFAALDPAYDYDLGGQTIIYNVYQTLLKIPVGGTSPVPDAASSCGFTGTVTFTCTLKPGLKFSNGNVLDAAAVVYSFKRMIAIKDANGPSTLLGAMKNVAAQGTDKVVFTLNQHDNTWQYILTTLAATIVDPKVFPAKARLADSKAVGSGVYKITSYQPKQQLVLDKNPNYTGDVVPANSRFIVKYEQAASTLKLDIEQGNVDIAFRSLSPTDITALRGETSRGVKVVEGSGAEIRYMVFQTGKGPGAKKAIRRAIAYLLDRASIAKNVFDDQVVPLYSMVANGLTGHVDAYKTEYGAAPDKAKATAELQAAGITTPLKIKMWYTPSHYGPVSADEWTEIKRQLDGSGLFQITLGSQEWEQYQKSYAAGAMDVFQLGWFPDYTDADDYLAPFYPNGGFFNNHYNNPLVNAQITKEKAEVDPAARKQQIETAQTLAAKDAPTVPIWQSKQFAAERSNVNGFESTLDPAYTFRFWVVSKS